MFVPVLDSNQKPLMPTTPARARKWIKKGKATPFFKKGVFCVRLNVEPSDRKVQAIAVGIDPGSKKEGFTVKSKAHTYLNIQANAVDWVSDCVKQRRQMRGVRRRRNTPCRANRSNRSMRCFPPSTKARWQWKLRVSIWLVKLFPVETFVVEDIKAKTKGKRKWDKIFSPLQAGKKWFYEQLATIAKVEIKRGFETKQFRDELGLKKSKDKMGNSFFSHCVDSWVLANKYTGGHTKPDNENIMFITPLRFHRRQLHVFQPVKGDIRKFYGGTISHGFKRGSLVKHIKYGLVYVGGCMKDRISVHSLKDGKRVSQKIKISDCKFLTYNTWRFVVI